MLLFKQLKRDNLSIIFAFLVLHVSCNQYEDYEEHHRDALHDQKSYYNMISDLKENIHSVLIETKPSELTLYEYKIKLIKGQVQLSEIDKKRILKYTKDLEYYGQEIANKNNLGININDKSEIFALGGIFSPILYSKFNEKSYQNKKKLTLEEIGYCAMLAIGADLIWTLQSSSTKWTIKSLTKAFSTVAKRFLGPIGVAIAVVTFGICLTEQSMD